jgi:hypothetical protein
MYFGIHASSVPGKGGGEIDIIWEETLEYIPHFPSRSLHF